MFARLIFIDGDQGRQIVDALTHTDGVVVHGATSASIEAVFEHLLQFDDGSYGDTTHVQPWGVMDDAHNVDGFVLSWNTGLGYVALSAVIGADGLPANVETCRGCGLPIDMCQDHTHEPDPYSEEWERDYNETARLIGSDVL